MNAFLWTLGFGLAVNLVVPAVLVFLTRDEDPMWLSPAAGILPLVQLTYAYGSRWGDEATAVLVWSAVHFTFSCGFLAWMTARFDQLVGRSPDTAPRVSEGVRSEDYIWIPPFR
jgi:hypothetical protein